MDLVLGLAPIRADACREVLPEQVPVRRLRGLRIGFVHKLIMHVLLLIELVDCIFDRALCIFWDVLHVADLVFERF